MTSASERGTAACGARPTRDRRGRDEPTAANRRSPSRRPRSERPVRGVRPRPAGRVAPSDVRGTAARTSVAASASIVRRRTVLRSERSSAPSSRGRSTGSRAATSGRARNSSTSSDDAERGERVGRVVDAGVAVVQAHVGVGRHDDHQVRRDAVGPVRAVDLPVREVRHLHEHRHADLVDVELDATSSSPRDVRSPSPRAATPRGAAGRSARRRSHRASSASARVVASSLAAQLDGPRARCSAASSSGPTSARSTSYSRRGP